MDEQTLRALVRAAIARHHGPGGVEPAGPPPLPLAAVAPMPVAVVALPGAHVSVARFELPRVPGQSECVIEPAVTCHHCGHCLCYGH